MEEQHQKLMSFFSETAGTMLERTDHDLNIRCFTEKQIDCITKGYSVVLGKGGFSIVYKGTLDDGRPVAVKRYIFAAKTKEFTKEVIIQYQFSHRNIVRLLGCCVDADAPMLVTEYVPNGTLSDLLHGKYTHQVSLCLDRRLQIATGIAEAVLYMHSSQSHPILHGDIKPENIFLDENYMPKVSDFGISRFLSMGLDEYTGYVIGSMGYIDPEFCQTGRLTTKSDVYSFGVVLLELITRKKAIDDNKNFLAKTFVRARTKSSSHELFDKEIATSENIEIIDDIVKLALECLKVELDERLEMTDASECLRKLQRAREKKRQERTACLRRFKFTLQKTGFDRFITEEEMNKMTDNFNIVPTKCFIGKVYVANSEGTPSVAIKMAFEVHSGSQKEFSRQMIRQSKINHKNVAMFVGCCLDHGDAPILVYEFSKVSLNDILFGDNHRNWIINTEERLNIATAIARGLSYLHSLGIIHGDVRTSNILMGAIAEGDYSHHFQIKVSGIWASVYSSVGNKAAHGRFKGEEYNGFMDPIFLESGIPTKEADVYSLGIILIELFTKKKVSDQVKNKQIQELWEEAVCQHLESLRQFTFKCLDPDVRKRPTIQRVAGCHFRARSPSRSLFLP